MAAWGLVLTLIGLETALLLLLDTGQLGVPRWLGCHLAACCGTALLGLASCRRASPAGGAAAGFLQFVAWSLVAGPFGAIAAAPLALSSPAHWADPSEQRQPPPDPVECLHTELLDGRLRLEGAHAVRPLFDVVVAGTQAEKLGALRLIANHYQPSLALALKRALQDKDNAVRVLAATVMAQQHNIHMGQIGALQALIQTAPQQSDAWLQLGKAHLAYGESGLLDGSRAAGERRMADDSFARAAALAPGDPPEDRPAPPAPALTEAA